MQNKKMWHWNLLNVKKYQCFTNANNNSQSNNSQRKYKNVGFKTECHIASI